MDQRSSDEEDYEAWREEPITRRFITALRHYAYETRRQFNEAAWAGRYISPEDQAWIAHLKGRSDTALLFAELEFEELESLFEEERRED